LVSGGATKNKKTNEEMVALHSLDEKKHKHDDKTKRQTLL
jgi:hypothetical protein